MIDTIREFQHSGRTLLRTPAFTLISVVTLTLGIAATSTVFTLVNAIVLRPLPYADSERLVAVGHTAPGLGLAEAGVSDGTFLHYRDQSRAFEGIATYYENVVNLSDDHGEAERVPVAMVSQSFFSVLGARTALGRLPTAEDFEGDDIIVLMSHNLWRARYGSDPNIVGTMITANRAPRRVIGVLEAGFAFPRPEIGIWYPSRDPNPARARASDLYQDAVARLRPGVDAAGASRELNDLIVSLPAAYPDFTEQLLAESQLRAVVTPLKDVIASEARAALWLLLGGMGFLLLIASANVANLFLIRGEHRQKETAVRVALGARRADLIRFFGTESLIVAAAAGCLGLLVTVWAVQAVVAYGPANLPRLHEVGMDVRVMGFTAAVSVLTAVFFAFVPFFRQQRVSLTPRLRQGDFAASASPQHQRARRLLVGGQVALALTLLVGSALMVQSFRQLERADPGFDGSSVLTAEIALPHRGYETYEATQRLWTSLIERVRALPGVETVGSISGLPLVPQPAYYDLAIDVEGRSDEARPAVTVYFVSPTYFETMRIPMLEGQGVAGPVAAEHPVLLSEAAARRLFPDERAVGRRVRRSVDSDGPWATIVGVVGDVPQERIAGAAAEILYIPILETAVDPGLSPSHGSLVLRTTVPPMTLAPAIRHIVRELDPHLPIARLRPMDRIVAESMSRTTFAMLLLSVAAAAALLLGATGVYGVVSYTVSRRMHEFGIRMALGARAEDVRQLVVRDAGGVALGGIVVGTLAALVLTRFLRGMLYEISPTDPLTLAGTAALLFAIAVFASWLPARRAARIEPSRALRAQ